MPDKPKPVKESKSTYRVKRTVAKLINATFTVVIESDDGGFHAYAPALSGCHTFGETIEEARTNIIEAMELHIESLVADGESDEFLNLLQGKCPCALE